MKWNQMVIKFFANQIITTKIFIIWCCSLWYYCWFHARTNKIQRFENILRLYLTFSILISFIFEIINSYSIFSSWWTVFFLSLSVLFLALCSINFCDALTLTDYMDQAVCANWAWGRWLASHSLTDSQLVGHKECLGRKKIQWLSLALHLTAVNGSWSKGISIHLRRPKILF